MRKSVALIAIAAAALAGCSAETATPAPEPAAAAAEPAGPNRLPIGEVTPDDIPALMAAAYPDGVPTNVEDLGIFLLGERVGLLTGADNADPCATCTGNLSLFYIVRTDAGFLLQDEHRDFHASGAKGKFNRDLEIVRFGGVDGGPSYAGFTDVGAQSAAGCSSQTLTVAIFTDVGPRIALQAPFGADKRGASVDARIIKPDDYQADFAIAYESPTDDFVAPYLFVNQGLRPSFPVPAWTQAAC